MARREKKKNKGSALTAEQEVTSADEEGHKAVLFGDQETRKPNTYS